MNNSSRRETPIGESHTMTKARPVLLFACFDTPADPWLRALARAMPDLEIRRWPDCGAREEIDYALVWKTPPGLYDGLVNLRAVFSLGAGVDGLLAAGDLPAGVPLVRMVDPSLVTGMTEFVLMQTLHYHRRMPDFAAQQRERLWRRLEVPLTRDRGVGIMGLGQLGRHCAEALAGLGFKVGAWSREPKEVPGIRCHAGAEGLPGFLAGCDILICLLPLTPETRGILNAGTFAQMPPGSHLINVGRGGHLVERDLTDALDRGHLAGATLDVFETEPLPADHPFWGDPRIVVVPHAAAPTQPDTAAPTVVEGIRRERAGEPLLHRVDPALGY